MSTDNNGYWQQPGPYAAQPAQAPETAPAVQAVQAAQAAQAAPAAQAAQPAFQAAPAYAAAAPAAAQPKKSRGWIVAIVVVLCIFGLFAISAAACTSMVNSVVQLGTVAGSSLDALDGDAVAVIDIDGTIQYDGSACSPEGLKALLDEAESDSNVKAIVLRVNSGGGTATAGEEMAEYVRQCSLPVVVSSASINASAAYEISSQADYIFVAKSTEIGAIGTVMTITDLSGLLEKLGVNMDTIASADEKDSSYGYRPLTDEERAYYQQMVDEINAVFIENVADGRGMSIDEVKALANGMPFTGVTAVQNGLADEVGTREDAIEKAAELAGLDDYTVTSLSFSYYDLSSLAYLLGEDRVTVDDIAGALGEAPAITVR